MTPNLVLVVEDGLNLCDLVSAALALEPNLMAVRATDGEQALEMARSMRPDLIVLDVRPLGLSSLKAARQLKSDPVTRSIPRVAMAPEPPSKSISRVCDYHVTRPYDLASLVERLRALPEVAA